jgi:hypothetical protein
MSIPARQLTTIAMTVALLVAILVLKRRCGETTAQLFRAIEAPIDAGPRRD